MVYGLAAVAFLALLYLTWRLAPSTLCPSMIFVGVWTVNILGLAFFSGPLYPVEATTLAIFFWGALWFVAGSLLIHVGGPPLQLRSHTLDPAVRAFATKVLTLSLLSSVVVFPFFVRQVIELAKSGTGDFFFAIRQASVATDMTNLGIGWTENFVFIAAFTAMGWLYLYDRKTKQKWLLAGSVALALAYGLLTGTKGGLINLVIILLFVSAIKRGRLSPRTMVVTSLSLAAAIIIGFIVFNLAAEQIAGVKLLGSLVEIVRLYWLGNMVAFDSLVSNPNAIEAVHSPARGLMLLANNFGAHYQVPSVHATYVTVGPGLVTNTYTIYFSYFTAFGWLGTALAMGLLGAVTTAVFRRAASGSPFFAMLFGVLAQRLVMSFHSEQFLIGINPFLKAVLFFALVFMVSWRRPSWSAADRKMDVSPA